MTTVGEYLKYGEQSYVSVTAPSAAMRKMIAARSELTVQFPFYGTLALRLKLVEDPTCPTGWTDGTELGFNPSYVLDTLTFSQCVFLWCHEVMHCALGHPWRRGNREPRQYNAAGDFAINYELNRIGMSLPENVLLDSKYDGLSSEEIYSILGEPSEEEEGQGQDQNEGQEEGEGQGEEGQEEGQGESQEEGNVPGGQRTKFDDIEQSNVQGGELRDAPADSDESDGQEASQRQTQEDWEQAVADAAQQSKMLGEFSAPQGDLVKSILGAKISWKEVLENFLQTAKKDTLSFRRPNRRYATAGVILPSRCSRGIGAIALGVDNSGSMNLEALQMIEAEANEIMAKIGPESITVIYCNHAVNAVETFEQGEPITLQSWSGGGTSFSPVFDFIDSGEIDECSALIYMTDTYGDFNRIVEPDYPVMWASTRPKSWSRTPTFGEIVYIPTEEGKR